MLIIIISINIFLILRISALPLSNDSEQSILSDQIFIPANSPVKSTLIQAQESIQEAIDAADPGDVLIVESGIYIESINITKSLTMMGRNTGLGPPVIDAGGKNSSVTLSADGISIEGFKIINSSERHGNAGLKLISNKNLIKDNIVTQNKGTGISLLGSRGNKIANNTVIENGLHGISLDKGSSRNEISYNIISRNNASGMGLWNDSDENLLEYNLVFLNQMGISLWSNCDQNQLLRNNASMNNFSGIQIYGCMESIVAGNIAGSNNYSGITAVSSSKGRIKDNNVSHNKYGINVAGSYDDEISGNLAGWNLQQGVKISDSRNMRLDENQFDGNREALLVTGSEFVAAYSNNASFNDVGIALQDCQFCSLMNNVAFKNNNGMVLARSSQCTFSSNQISYNHLEGLVLGSSNENVIEENEFEGNYDGIYIDNASGNSIKGNRARENIDHGILLMNNSSKNYVSENYLQKNGWGILIAGSQDNILQENIARNNYYGLYLYYSQGNNVSGTTLSENIYNFGDIGFSSSNALDLSNTADGKLIYYLVGESEATIDEESKAGVVYCIDCRNITIKDLSISNSSRAVYLRNTTGSRITGNRIRSSWNGIFLDCSPGNLLEANDVESTENAIFLDSSHLNRLGSNRAVNNSYGIVLEGSRNNSIASNTASINYAGLLLAHASDSNTVQENDLKGNGIGIYLNSSSGNLLQENNASRSEYVGIDLVNSSGNEIQENSVDLCWLGVYLKGSWGNLLKENRIEENQKSGLHFFESSSNIISQNKACKNHLDGIMLDESDNNNLSANVADCNLRAGIRIQNSSRNTLEENAAANNTWGLYHENSSQAVMRGNFMAGNRYNFYSRGLNDIDTSNQINSALFKENRSVYYLVNDSDRFIGPSSGAGTVYCFNCSNITINSINLTNSVYGILLENTSSSRIEGSNLSGNQVGLGIFASRDNFVNGNEILYNEQDGLLVMASERNSIGRNNVTKNKKNGIVFRSSSSSEISFNLVAENVDAGIKLNGSRLNSLISNRLEDNGAGILLDFSGGNTLDDNRMENHLCNFNVTGQNLADFDNNIPSSNLLNEKPLYYLVNVSDIALNSTSRAGSVFGFNCSNLTLENLTIADNYLGIYLRHTSDSKVTGNRLINNIYGLYLFGCENNSLESNLAIRNELGYYLRFSDKNILFRNRASSSTGSGISLQGSSRNILKENIMEDNRYGLDINRENDIDISNRVNGHSVYLLANEWDRVIDDNVLAGAVYCFNCTNITIRAQNLSAAFRAISLFNTSGSLIEDNYLSNNWEGIYLENSSENAIKENRMVQNSHSGINLSLSDSNHLEGNVAEFNQHGISLLDSKNNTIASNSLAENSGSGIRLLSSPGNNLTDNRAYRNGYGMSVEASGESRMSKNNLSANRYNFALSGDERAHLINFIEQDNLADGKPIIFLIGSHGEVIDKNYNAAAVYCIDCNGITLQDQNISNSQYGIYLYNTTLSRVIRSSVRDCETGIILVDSESNTLDKNRIEKNGFGIYLKDSSSNQISQNLVARSSKDGIKLFESNENAIWKNNIKSCNLSGIHLDPSNNNNVTSNYVQDNGEDNVNYGSGSESNNLRDNGLEAESAPSGIGTGRDGGEGTAPEAETVDYSALVEAEKCKLKEGKIAFEPEREMIVGEVYRVEARISIDESMEDLIAGLSTQGKVMVKSIPVSTFMKVRLTGPKFDISPISDERQLVAKGGYREWLWDVTPMASGTHNLTLSAFAEIVLPGQQPMTIDSRVFCSQITVKAKEVPVAEKTEGFLQKNWQFILGTLIIGSGLLKWILGKIKANASKAKGQAQARVQDQKNAEEGKPPKNR